MMGHGGWKYANPEVYAWAAFAEAFAALSTLPALWITIVRRQRKGAVALIIICVAYAGISVILGQINWSTRAALLSTLGGGLSAERTLVQQPLGRAPSGFSFFAARVS